MSATSPRTPSEIKDVVLRALGRIAPEVDASAIVASGNFRQQTELDSMDYLNLLVALHEELGVEIPEADYPLVATLDGLVAYLTPRVPARARPA